MSDLTTVPIEELIKEMMDRTESCVIGYTRIIDNKEPSIFINHQCKGGWLTGVGLCDVIKTDLIDRNFIEEDE